MADGFEIVSYKREAGRKMDIRFLNREVAEKTTQFHKSFPGYCRTPLARLKNAAKEFGVADIFVKDAPKDTQEWALEYIKEVLGKAEPAAINKYSELVNDLTKFVEGK